MRLFEVLLGAAVASLVTGASSDAVRVKNWRKCGGGRNCLKTELVRLASRLGNLTQVRLAPGLSLVATDRTQALATRLAPLAASPSLPLWPFLQELLSQYLGSLNLTLQLHESTLLDHLKGFTGHVWKGRGRRSNWFYIVTLSVAGFAILAVFCGKALMASMLALMISALLALRSPFIGFAAAAAADSPSSRVTQYEIISKPAYAPTAPAYYEEQHFHTTNSSPYGKRYYAESARDEIANQS